MKWQGLIRGMIVIARNDRITVKNVVYEIAFDAESNYQFAHKALVKCKLDGQSISKENDIMGYALNQITQIALKKHIKEMKLIYNRRDKIYSDMRIKFSDLMPC